MIYANAPSPRSKPAREPMPRLPRHSALNTYPTLRHLVKAWLQAGVMDGGELFPTLEGVPHLGDTMDTMIITQAGRVSEVAERLRAADTVEALPRRATIATSLSRALPPMWMHCRSTPWVPPDVSTLTKEVRTEA